MSAVNYLIERLESEEKNQFQTITLKFSNGQRIVAAVPIFCQSHDIEKIEIIGLEISEPTDLQPGCKWATPFPASDKEKKRELVLNYVCSCDSPTSSVCMVHGCVG